jgi:hypothetical protein
MSQYNKSTILANKVLETWPGTPEELGADLEICTDTFLAFTEQQRQADAERRNSARLRIVSCAGGQEFYDFYLKERLENETRQRHQQSDSLGNQDDSGRSGV